MSTRKVVFIGSHLGYPMDRTPLGGGAMVGLQLIRHWPAGGPELVALGSGPVLPRKDVEYVALAGGERELVSLSELAYAAFCREFERASTDWLLARRARFDPAETCVLVNDISEGPDLARIEAAGYPIASIWHVDVVDYFNKMYLRQVMRPERMTRLYELARRFGGAALAPDVLKLVFEKQRETVLRSRRLILPSRAMAETVARCYGGLFSDPGELARRSVIVPWGVWQDGVPPDRAASIAASLRDHYQLKPDSLVLMTLSRISPEKGIHLLLEALRQLEQSRALPGRDICLFICGEAAFMQGAAYMRRVRRAAARLGSVRVFFPGYLDGVAKRAYFELADLFVSPSIHESYGLNLVEAMRAGLAVLASDHYGVRDLLADAYGRKVEYSSVGEAPALLANALKELLSDRQRLKDMGRLARAAAEKMPFSKAVEKIIEVSCALLPERAVSERAL